jgi:hypothetical protein
VKVLKRVVEGDSSGRISDDFDECKKKLCDQELRTTEGEIPTKNKYSQDEDTSNDCSQKETSDQLREAESMVMDD